MTMFVVIVGLCCVNHGGKRLDLYGLAQPSGKSKDMIWQKPFATHSGYILVSDL
jgi:hypothetical protein